ncbi:exported protein of unknown function [Sterolibacterium denitrificans]|uniref:AsmA domain-containing protein n=2 Tax=Sterolibacterium denitrificans TaxID=157592 RepID=A0A7Z7HP88_9PROT|nr:exported protein of unknown function [Sterolibacterium denitrificans]
MIFRRTRSVLFIAIIALLSCTAIGLTVAAVFLARIDAAWIAGELNRSVLADKRRVLKIDGALTVNLRPALGLELWQIALSEQDSEATFASLDRLRFSLQWWPLLSRRLVVDRLELDGLSVAGERDAQGRYNFADLLESQPGGKWTFDIASLQLTQGRLRWRDPEHAQGITLDEISLSSGRIANDGTPSGGRLALAARLRSPAAPQADVQLHASMQYTLDPARAHYGADDLALRLTGRLAEQPDVDIDLTARKLMVDSKPSGPSVRLQDLQLQARAAAIAAMSPVALSLAAPQLEFQDKQLRAATASMVLQAGSENANANTDANSTPMSLHGRLDTPIVADLAARSVQLDKLAAELTIVAAQKLARPVRLTLQGSARADLQQQQAAARLAGRLDGSQLAGWLDATGFSSAGAATIRFGLDVDRFNVDDYLRTTASPAASAGTSSDAVSSLPPGLDLQGELKVGNLQAAGVTARNLRLVFATRDGRLHMLTAPQ